MARNEPSELCMMCMQSPCICVTNKPRGAAKKAAKNKPPAQSMADRMRTARSTRNARPTATAPDTPRNAPGAAGRATVPSTPADRAESQLRPVEQLVEEDAIRNLAPLLHETEIERHRMVLTTSPTPRERAAIWRYRRAQR